MERTEMRGENKKRSAPNERETAIAKRRVAREEEKQARAVARHTEALAEHIWRTARDLRKRADALADDHPAKAEDLRDAADAAARDAERREDQARRPRAYMAKAIAARNAAEVQVLFGFQYDLVKFTGEKAIVCALQHAQAQNPTVDLTVNLLIDALLLPDNSRKDELLRICKTHELELSDSVHYKGRPSV